MTPRLKFFLFVASLVTLFESCNNDGTSSTEEKKDSISHTTTQGSDSMNMSQELMTSMMSMMDTMKAVKMTGDFDIDYANMMIKHHSGAIAMSEKELRFGKDEKIKGIAEHMITAQKEEINHLQSFLKNYKSSGMKHGEGDMEKSMNDMESKMKNIGMSGNFDKDFVSLMIPHHEGAIAMSKLQLTNGMNDKLKQLAQKGIAEQTKEVEEFKTWLANK